MKLKGPLSVQCTMNQRNSVQVIKYTMGVIVSGSFGGQNFKESLNTFLIQLCHYVPSSLGAIGASRAPPQDSLGHHFLDNL